jgi:wingless-type MMTV integration site family protein 10
MNIRRKPDEKRRQKEDKYFFNSVMERQRRKPRPTSAICKNFPGLSKKQLELCFRYPDVMSAAIGGLQLAVNECQFQFQKHRWNCSALERKNRNPHSSNFLQKGERNAMNFRQIAFLPLSCSHFFFLNSFTVYIRAPFHVTGYTICTPYVYEPEKVIAISDA